MTFSVAGLAEIGSEGESGGIRARESRTSRNCSLLVSKGECVQQGCNSTIRLIITPKSKLSPLKSATPPPSSSPVARRDLLFLLFPFAFTLLTFQPHCISTFPLIIVHVGVQLARSEARRIDIVRRTAETSATDGRPVFLVLCASDRIRLQIDLGRRKRLCGMIRLCRGTRHQSCRISHVHMSTHSYASYIPTSNSVGHSALISRSLGSAVDSTLLLHSQPLSQTFDVSQTTEYTDVGPEHTA